jgi:hypothetical protein
MLDRFAGDVLKGGLLGALTGGKDFSQGVIPGLIGRDMSGGILGTVIGGDKYPSLSNIQSGSVFGLDPEVAQAFQKRKVDDHYGIMS